MTPQITAEEILIRRIECAGLNAHIVEAVESYIKSIGLVFYTPAEVLAIMEKVRGECIFQFTDAMGTQQIDLNEFLTK